MEYILGILVSLLVEGLKRFFGTNTFGTYATLVVVSLLGATGYYFLAQHQNYLAVLTQILITAGAFHNFVIRQMAGSTTPQAPQ